MRPSPPSGVPRVPLLVGLFAIVAALAVVELGGLRTSPAAAADTGRRVISVEPNDTPLSAWGDWAVWSRRKGDGFHLIARRPDGTGVELPAPIQSRPIDASIGPGPDGGPLVVYSRCTRTTHRVPTGCDVWSLDPRTGADRPVPSASQPGVDERLPAVWGTRIAFARSTPRHAATRSAVAVADLDGDPPAHARFAGPRRERVHGHRRRASTAVVGGIALRGSTVAFSWTTTADRTRWRLLTSTSGRRARTLLSVRSTSQRVVELGRPAIGDREVYVPLLRTGGGGHSSVVRARLHGSRRRESLRSGFTAAQTARYGSAITAVARPGDDRLLLLRRLASDGRWGCRTPSHGTTRGCEIVELEPGAQHWRRGVH